MDYINSLIKLTKQLYPTGRAFKLRNNGAFFTLHLALSDSENRFLQDLNSIYNSLIPDNDYFSEDDAANWERALGLTIAPNISLEERKIIIYDRMQYPGTVRERQSWQYLQGRLRNVGFDVYVNENIPVNAVVHSIYGNYNYGDVVYGLEDKDFTICANYISEADDENYDVGLEGNYKATFYVGGINQDDFATVPLSRKNEFRSMILKLKPAQTVGLLRINYV